MNSTEKGDIFEQKCYDVLNTALQNGELGIIPQNCQIFQKKKYYSSDREDDIVFDLSIEVTLPRSKKPTLVYIIECKDLNHNIPVDDVEEFQSKLSGIKGFQTKGVFIAKKPLQKSGKKIANNKGFMFIQLNDDGYNIILDKKERILREDSELVLENIRNKIYESFLTNSIYGLKKITKKEISKISIGILNDFISRNEYKYLNIENFILFLEKYHNVTFGFLTSSCNEFGQFIPKTNTILINQNLVGSNKYSFIVFHEVAHYFLHRNVRINGNLYESFTDAQFDFVENKYSLNNAKNWIEWQANYLAACLLLPEHMLYNAIVMWQTKNSIRNKGTIFLDKQRVNKEDYINLSNHLCATFNTTKTVIKYRLLDLKILIIDPSYSTKNATYSPLDNMEKIRQQSLERDRARNY
ncbi:MAG: ImmA/IrrE family metallo-endopeptidase [Weeksellaceae bacterium]|nr:ImmA/IrrE family metallo-endopeptidase [Weeksellaceae bacterium]